MIRFFEIENSLKIGVKVFHQKFGYGTILSLEGDKATINFSKELMPNTAQFYPHMLYPGTGSFKWADDNGYVKTKNWAEWLTPDGLHNTVLELPGLKRKDLLHWSNKGRFEFYLNPKYLFKMLVQSVRSPKEGIRMFISGKTFFIHLLSIFSL